jgi:hypothetical protein
MKKLLLILSTLFLANDAHAQFENRVNLYIGLGITPFAPDQSIQTESVFNGYRTIPFVQAYLGYSVNRSLSIGGTFRQLVTSKDNYLLSNSSLGPAMKYNFLPYDKAISPFVYVEIGINYTYLSQTQNTRVVQEPPPSDPTEIRINEITIREPELQLNIFPTFSSVIGAGVEFNIKKDRKKNFGLFIMGGYSLSTTASSNQLQENFPQNNSELNNFLISGGLRFSFLRKKSIY